MDALVVMSIFRLYPGIILSFKHKSIKKNYFYVHVAVGILDFLCLRWTKNINLMEPLVLGTRSWSF